MTSVASSTPSSNNRTSNSQSARTIGDNQVAESKQLNLVQQAFHMSRSAVEKRHQYLETAERESSIFNLL